MPRRRHPGAHDHVVFEMSSGSVVTFTDPRRFGAMDLLTREAMATHETLVASSGRNRSHPSSTPRRWRVPVHAARCR